MSVKMKIAGLMPTMRWRNWHRLMAHLQFAAAEAPGLEFTWIPIMTAAERSALPMWVHHMIRDEETWSPLKVRPIFLKQPLEMPHVKIADQKIDAAIRCLEKDSYFDDAYFWTGSDDNLVPRSFCRRFMEGLPKKIIVGSHKRGSGPGESGHGTSDLVAEHGGMRIGSVSGEQYLIHASVMRGRTFLTGGCPDGRIIEDLVKEMPDEFHYLPDFWIPFNALEVGRWQPGEVEKVLAV